MILNICKVQRKNETNPHVTFYLCEMVEIYMKCWVLNLVGLQNLCPMKDLSVKSSFGMNPQKTRSVEWIGEKEKGRIQTKNVIKKSILWAPDAKHLNL